MTAWRCCYLCGHEGSVVDIKNQKKEKALINYHIYEFYSVVVWQL